ncbi:hypothetical protein CVR96_27280, partial [Salmonella enterica subsp. enterica serovar Typhimurium]
MDSLKIAHGTATKLASCQKPPSCIKKQGWKEDELRGIRMFAWRSSKSPMVHVAIDNRYFKQLGLVSLT